MSKPKPIPPATLQWDSQARLLLWLASVVSVIAFLSYFQRGETLLYGDAVAHINIARRVFDSKTPGLLQLGTVWLPLPHLLMIPFLLSTKLWQTGAGGSIPSLAAYMLAVVGIFRLLRVSLASRPDEKSSFAAWVGTVVFAADPNLIYMQSTAMGEALYLALFIWGLVYLREWRNGEPKALTKCGICIAAACLTRYDGWFLGTAMVATALLLSFLRNSDGSSRNPANQNLVNFVLIAASAPLLWLAYNAVVYRNPLEFENGPYSAKAIEQRTQSTGNPGHPGAGNLIVASQYFLKAAEENMAQNLWMQRLWLILGGLGLIAILAAPKWKSVPDTSASSDRLLSLLFLLVPLPFYSLSISYGGVPIFVPAFWPYTHYNVRYGLQLLPAFAALVAVLAFFLVDFKQWNLRLRSSLLAVLLAVVASSYISVWHATPICLEEAQINMRTRNQLEKQLASWLEKLPSGATLLMYLGDHVGALEQAGIPLSHTINEGNHRVWMRPADPDGLWERALSNPAKYADFVIAFEGDPVWQALQGKHLQELVEIHVTGQARAVVYRAR